MYKASVFWKGNRVTQRRRFYEEPSVDYLATLGKLEQTQAGLNSATLRAAKVALDDIISDDLEFLDGVGVNFPKRVEGVTGDRFAIQRAVQCRGC